MIYPNEVTYIPRKGGQKKIFAPQTTIIENKKEDNTKAPINFPRIAIAEKINETTKVPDKVVPEIETIIKKSVTPPINQGVKKDNIKVQNKKINISTESVDNIIKKVRRNGIMKKAIQFGIVGLGQGGCRIAGEFEKLGYKTLAINTSEQDLGETPCKEKLLIGTGGAGRNLKTGAEAVNTHRAEIMTAYQTTFPNIQHALVCSGSSGGCISGDSIVYTTYCGGESFETLFNKVTKDRPLFRHPFNNGLFCDISDLNISVPSLENNKFTFNKIKQIWKFNVPHNKQVEVKFNDNSTVTTSEWHEFPVLKSGKIEWIKSVDLKNGDVVISGKISNWPINTNLKVDDIEIDENIGWLVGLLCGDGCICNTDSTYRVRFKNMSKNVLEKATIIMKNLGFNCNKPQHPKNNKSIELVFTNKEKVEWLKKISELNYGHKDQWHIPFFVWKSPKNVINAFLGGLVDSDFHVQKNRFNMRISTTSKNVYNELPALLNIVYGISTIVNIYDPKDHTLKTSRKNRNVNNWAINYIINIRGEENTNKLITNVLKFVHVEHKINNMKQILLKNPSGGKVETVPIKFKDMEPLFQLVGCHPHFTRSDKSFYNWKHRSGFPSKKTFIFALDMIKNHINNIRKKWADKQLLECIDIVEKRINTMHSLMDNVKYVVEKKQPENEKTMYDFNINNSQNYLAGYSGLTVIHNTGGGGLTSIIDTLKDYKIPVGVITTLPLNTEDTRSKKNTLSVLNELVKLNAEKKISPLIIIDNDKIEKKHPGLSTLEFWNMANEEVVKCFDVFNMLAFRTSAYTSFDPADYKRVLVSGGCMIFGTFTVTNEIQVDTLANAIASNINSGLLAEGFNLVEATTAACLIVGNPEKLQKLPRVAEENAFAMLMKLLGSGTIFKGVYPLQATPDFELFFMISGLGLPTSRVKSLIEHTKVEKEHLEKKATLRTVDDIMKELQTETETNGNGS